MTAERYLDAGRVRRMLSLSPSGLYGLAQAGKLPGAVKVGRVWRFHEATLLGWLAEQRAGHRTSAAPRSPRPVNPASELTDEERAFLRLDRHGNRNGQAAGPSTGGTGKELGASRG